MLVKLDDGFYINTQHIIAVRIEKSQQGGFVVATEYTPNSAQKTGVFEKQFDSSIEAEMYLQNLHKAIS
ncbi:hypothetical protein [Acinetobacter tianfuensis]|uniref:Uncharacterized protein n=1 Tax=Acinetobacter tianfuensis TaxID=2419603 RepID=A0A3A8EPZ3_9GAMM|nr:hypothetical protein [Acinetobacter tianfuensis]RKG30951.1 hypothetical protein D7V32_09850 [Acinetobacter tianfuensis]